MRKICLIIAASLLTPMQANAAPETETIVVCYPGGGSLNIRDAGEAMNAMLRVIERIGQWRENSFTSLFAAKGDECRKNMAEKNPKFSISSLGLYLELRGGYHLTPLVQPTINGRNNERYRVMVRKGQYRTLEELKGKTIGGTVLEENNFIDKIVFAGKYDLSAYFVLKTSNQAIRTLRALDKGELDAVILNQQQFDGLPSLHLETPLETVFTSEEIPLMGVTANSSITTEEERARFAKSLEGLCTDNEGKKLCELFGVDSFHAVEAATFAPFIKLWVEGT